MTQDICLYLQNGTRLMVPNRLDAITTYVILEQERWFEKEWRFVDRLLEPGMTALDIGANLGIYAIGMAKAVGPTGRVYAYEPTSVTRARLELSASINGAENLTVIGSALSDTEREGRIVFGTSSELNRLGDADEGTGEAVHLTSVDLEAKRLNWGAIDFIKMDAEGEELKIIAGGHSVFAKGTPIVMFEIKSETASDLTVARQFEAMGYGLYRLLADEQHLVPFAEDDLDSFELNLFAIKPETAQRLVARDIVATDVGAIVEPGDWQGFVDGLPCRTIEPMFDTPPEPGGYARGLAAYAGWRDERRPIADRYACLRDALFRLRGAAEEDRSLSRLLSLARAEYDAGHRARSYDLLVDCAKALDRGEMPGTAFVPASSRSEHLVGPFKPWLLASCIEALQQRGSYSTFYGSALPQLDWVASTPFSSSEIERRRALSAALRGRNIELRRDLRRPAQDHLNAEAWVRLMG